MVPRLYKNVIVGEYFADLFVEEKVVELKVDKQDNSADEFQLLNEIGVSSVFDLWPESINQAVIGHG